MRRKVCPIGDTTSSILKLINPNEFRLSVLGRNGWSLDHSNGIIQIEQDGFVRTSSNSQENVDTLTFEDGTPVPMREDGNPDFLQMTPEQSAELYETQFGEDAWQLVDDAVTTAKKALDESEEEVVADTIGDMINDLGLAKGIAFRLSHPVLAHIQNVLTRILGKLGLTSPLYEKFRDVRDTIAQAYVDTMPKEEVEAEEEAQNNGNSFSLRLQSAIDETEREPSDAQKESGNYKKGHVKFGGYDFTIENPKGSYRSGRDADGKEWKQKMNDTYGYIRGTYGKDGDHLDMFINDKADLDNWNGNVYVVDQVNKDGSFDEHKVMYGFDSEEDAKKAYLSNYEKGWQGLGNITGVSKDAFDKWLDSSSRKTKPFAEYSGVKNEQAQSEETDLKPVGVGAFGNIYNQFRGKAKAAIKFLKKLGSGEAVAALHHHSIGDISLVWGDKKTGLAKILKKHPEVVGNLQSIIDKMDVVQESDNRIKLESPTHFAVISREYKGEPRENWLLTAYEKRDSLENGKSMDTATTSLGDDTALSQSKESSANISNSSETSKEKGEKFSLREDESESRVYSDKAGVPTQEELGEGLSEEVKDYVPQAVPWNRGVLYDGQKSPIKYSARGSIVGMGMQPLVDSDGKLKIVDGMGREFDKNHPVSVDDLKRTDSALNAMVDICMSNGTLKDPDVFYQKYADFVNRLLEKGDRGFSYVSDQWMWEGEALYRSVHNNGDEQYAKSIDITRICKKNEAVIHTISELQKRQGYGVTVGQILDIYNQTVEDGYQAPCPVCYVFSRYLRNGVFASTLVAGQRRYGDMLVDPRTLSDKEKRKRVDYWVKELGKLEQFYEENKKAIGQAKIDIQNIFTEVDRLAMDITSGKLKGKELADAKKRIGELDKRYRAAVDLVSVSDLTGYIKSMAIEKKGGQWTLRTDSWKHYPEDVALDITRAQEAIVEFPGVQRYRNSHGSAAGKSIQTASNNDLGDTMVALGLNNPEKRDKRSKQLSHQNLLLKAFADETTNAERTKLLNMAKKDVRSAMVYAAQQALRGGIRQWSWSDNVERLSPDVFMNLMQVGMLGGALQAYSKQLEGVELVASMNGYVNGSLMGKGKGYREVDKDFKDAPVYYNERDGKYYTLDFDDVVGIEPFSRNGKLGLFDLNKMYDRAGNILVGMNDIHTRAAMADPRVFFIIPWHSSGMTNHILYQFYNYLGVDTNGLNAQDYTKVQEEKTYGADEDVPQEVTDFWESHNYGGKYRSGIGEIPSGKGKLSPQQIHYRELKGALMLHNSLVLDRPASEIRSKADREDYKFWTEHRDWLDEIKNDEFLSLALAKVQDTVNVHGASMTKGDTEFVYPYEYWDAQSTEKNADVNGERYMEYCRRLGMRPKFIGITNNGTVDFGNFCEDPGYWKLLIDRRMYDRKGNFQDLTPVTVDGFNVDMVDPEKTKERFDVTRVAELDKISDVVDHVQAREQERGIVPEVDYGQTLKKAVDKYNKSADTKFSLREVNDRFNERLDELVKNPKQKDRILRLGRSSSFLKAGGVTDAEIELDFDKLIRKSKADYKNNHPFSTSDLKNLPIAIAEPIAVFNDTKTNDHVVLTELQKDGKNFIVVIRAVEQHRKGGVVLEVNQISSLYPKEEKGIVHWINTGRLSNVDKEKALHFIMALQPHAGTTIKDKELSTAAKIVKDFENPNISEEKKFSIRTYHGSGADFTEFDNSHMGEGEGAQAYGWGTYVTEVEGIGRTYAEQNARYHEHSDMEREQADEEIAQRVLNRFGGIDCELLLSYAGNGEFEDFSLPRDRETLEKFRTYFKENPSDWESYEDVDSYNFDDEYDREKFARQAEESMLPYAEEEAKEFDNIFGAEQERYLYQVKIPDDNGSNYLDWNGRNSADAVNRVASGLEAQGWERKEEDGIVRLERNGVHIVLNEKSTGADLYEELNVAFKSQQKASELLAKVGYTGIKYPADNMRGGREDGKKNYVIFNEKDAKIVNQKKFSLRGNKGYVGNSKSVRAVDAENRGLRPKSRIDADFVDEVREIVKGRTGSDSQITLKDVREIANKVKADEWHHTGVTFNRTDYYSSESIADYITSEDDDRTESLRSKYDDISDQMSQISNELMSAIRKKAFDGKGKFVASNGLEVEANVNDVIRGEAYHPRVESTPEFNKYGVGEYVYYSDLPSLPQNLKDEYQTAVSEYNNHVKQVRESMSDEFSTYDTLGEERNRIQGEMNSIGMPKFSLREHKQKQLDIINVTNPMLDDYHTGIRNVEDIKTFAEAMDEARKDAEKYEYDEWSSYPDEDNEMLQDALNSGVITIYSSKPIVNGNFVTPSRMQAEDYAGGRGNKVYEKTVPVTDVAWINVEEGQYAKVDNGRFSLKEVNDRFNSDLKNFIEKGIFPENSRFELGFPSNKLLSAGFPNLPISMRVSLLNKKAGMERHPFSPSDMYDMVDALQTPIAVFEYTKDNMRNLIIDLTRNGKHFLVGVTLNYRKGELAVNSISGLFPKENHEWIKWIQDGKAIRIDQKEKVLSLIDSLRTNPEEAERIGLNLDSAAKIVRIFKNPNISEENVSSGPKFSLRQSYDDRLSDWKKRNGFAPDEKPMDKPVRGQNESIGDFMVRMADYAKNAALWKTAPRPSGYREALEQWKKDNGIPVDEFRPAIPRKADYATDDEYQKARDQYKQEMDKWKGAPKASDYDLSVDLDDMANKLTAVRSAMLNQRSFDRQTIEGITDMVKTMLALGWGDRMTRGKIGNLLVQLKRMNGNTANAKEVINETMGILADNYIKNLEAAYKKMTSNKGVRKDDTGVIRIGSLDAEGQAIIDEHNKALTMSDADIAQREGDLLDALTNGTMNDTLANARLEGIRLAKLYRSTISTANADIDTLTKQIRSLSEKKNKTKAERELLQSLKSALTSVKIDKARMYLDMLGEMGADVRQSKEGAKKFRENVKKHRNHILGLAEEDMEGMDATSSL